MPKKIEVVLEDLAIISKKSAARAISRHPGFLNTRIRRGLLKVHTTPTGRDFLTFREFCRLFNETARDQ